MIYHNALCSLFVTPTFCISIPSGARELLNWPQEKLKTMLMQNSFGSEVQKGSFLAENHHQKLLFFVVDFLGKKIDLKTGSLHLQQF